MSILLPTRTITVNVESNAVLTGDPTEVPDLTWLPIAANVRAHIGAAGGARYAQGGQQIDAILLCDLNANLTENAQIVDGLTGEIWYVKWCQRAIALGLDHWKAGLVRIRNAG